MSTTDINLVSFSDQSGLFVEDRVFQSSLGEAYADTLKCSCLTDSVFRRCASIGGQENALDMNRMCNRVRFEDCALTGGEQAAIVIKGGCSNVIFDSAQPTSLTRSKDSWCDVLIDDWSDQSQEPSRQIDLRGLYRPDGAKVRVVFGRWVMPLLPANAEILVFKSIGLHAYNIGKGILRKLHLA